MVEGKSTIALPANASHINYSSNTVFSRKSINQGYSVKYVLSGLEQYEVNGRRYGVGAGRFLVVGHGSESEVYIKSREAVVGMCLYLNSDLVTDVWNTLKMNQGQLLDQPATTERAPALLEQLFSASHTLIGEQLTTLAGHLQQGRVPERYLTEELFYNLAYSLCQLQQQRLGEMQALPAHKKATREELYRRLCQARDFLHDNPTEPVSLPQLAEVASLSEYHFLRSFKAAFGATPYHYALQLRLEQAKALLSASQLAIGEIALTCGFNELQAFAKLFRKATGLGPLAYRQQHQK
jgi:AraC-like DNA-binding protein